MSLGQKQVFQIISATGLIFFQLALRQYYVSIFLIPKVKS